MKIDIYENRVVNLSQRFLGINGENNYEILQIELYERLITEEAEPILEILFPDNTKKNIVMTRVNETAAEIEIKSSLLSQSGVLDMQFTLYAKNDVIFKSKIFKVEVEEAINSTTTIEDDYPTIINEIVNIKAELNNMTTQEEVEQIIAESENNMKEYTKQEITLLKTKTGNKVNLTIDNDYIMRLQLLNDNNEVLDAAEIDLPLESMVINAEYSEGNITLTLQNGNTTTFSIVDIISGLVNESTFQEAVNLFNKEIEELQSRVEQLEEENEQIKSALPTETVEGESITLDDATDMQVQNFEIYGNSYQDTRKGYNILPNELTPTTQGGITSVQNDDGSITFNGTSTSSNNMHYIFNNKAIKLPAGTYTAFLNYSGAIENGTVYFRLRDGSANNLNNKYIAITAATTNKGIQNYTTNEEFDLEECYLFFSNGVTVTNLTIYPILVKGEYTADTFPNFEKYGAMPSMTYPSVTRDCRSNINKFNCKDAHTDKGLTLTRLSDGSFKIEGTATSTGSFEISDYFVIDGTNTYTYELVEGNYSGSVWFWNRTDSNSSITLANNSTKTAIFEEEKEIGLAFSVTSGTFYSFIGRVKIEEGKVSTPYSPYGQGSVEISIKNKDIFDINEYPFELKTAYNNGSLVSWDGYSGIKGYFPIKENTEYSFSNNLGLPIVLGLVFYDKDKNILSYINSSTITFTTPKDCKYVRFAIKSSILPRWVQIEEGRVVTEFVAHQSQVINIPVRQPMYDGDTFINVDGVWKEAHYWKEYILDGTKEFTMTYGSNLFDKQSFFATSTSELYNNIQLNKAFCNMYKFNPVQSSINANLSNGEFAVQKGTSGLNLFFRNTEYSDAEAFNAKILELYEAGTPITVMVKSSIPTYIDCTEEQIEMLNSLNEIKTYKNITYMYSTNEIKPKIKCTYYQDIKIIEQKQNKRLSQIEELLSTTMTSALLLDNLQTDMESEV